MGKRDGEGIITSHERLHVVNHRTPQHRFPQQQHELLRLEVGLRVRLLHEPRHVVQPHVRRRRVDSQQRLVAFLELAEELGDVGVVVGDVRLVVAEKVLLLQPLVAERRVPLQQEVQCGRAALLGADDEEVRVRQRLLRRERRGQRSDGHREQRALNNASQRVRASLGSAHGLFVVFSKVILASLATGDRRRKD